MRGKGVLFGIPFVVVVYYTVSTMLRYLASCCIQVALSWNSLLYLLFPFPSLPMRVLLIKRRGASWVLRIVHSARTHALRL